VFDAEVDRIPVDSLAGAPDGEIAEQDRLGERRGIVREVAHGRLSGLDRLNELLEVAGRLREVDFGRVGVDPEALLAVVVRGVDRILVADDQRAARRNVLRLSPQVRKLAALEKRYVRQIPAERLRREELLDRKSTRLNS